VNAHQIKETLLCCIIINYVLVTVWFSAFFFAHAWLYRLHSRWFKLSTETFDAVNYAGMGIYKIGIMIFNLVPFIALCICSH
jgi:hypothetical protein